MYSGEAVVGEWDVTPADNVPFVFVKQAATKLDETKHGGEVKVVVNQVQRFSDVERLVPPSHITQ